MSRKQKYLGEKFGYLTAIETAPIIYKGRRYGGYKCVCVCGEIVVIKTTNLAQGVTKSCGCKRYEIRNRTNTANGFIPGHKRAKYCEKETRNNEKS